MLFASTTSLTVASLTPSNPLVITDTTANTASQSYTYSIKSSNCPGNQHTTIHLQSNGNNLSWNTYSYYWFPWDTNAPPPLQGYYIYKRNGSSNFILIDSTISQTYTDLNFQNGDEYFVEEIKIDGCQSNSWQKTNSPIRVRSNKLKIGTSGIGTPEQTLIKYFVNGSTLFVELKKTDDVSVHDLLGREIIHQRTDKLNVQLKTGIYLMNVGTKEYKVIIH